MNTSEATLTVIGELRTIIFERDKIIVSLKTQLANELIEKHDLKTEVNHLSNTVRHLNAEAMKDTVNA